MSHRTTQRALIRPRLPRASSPNPANDRSKSRIGSYSFFHHEFERVCDPTQLISKNFDSIFFIEGTPDSLVIPGGVTPEPIHDSHSTPHPYKTSRGGIEDKKAEAFSKPSPDLWVFHFDVAAHTDIDNLTGAKDRFRSTLLAKNAHPHQNRPPRIERVFSEAARTSRYTAGPSPGSESPLWMHSMR